MEQKKVIIIEDDNDDFIFMSEALNEVAPQVNYMRFSNAEDLFLHLEGSDDLLPSLFIIDYNLPLVNGVELLQRLNKSNSYNEVPKVFYSNSTFGKHKTDAVDNGAAAYFVKGRDMNDIRQNMIEVLMFSYPAVL